MAALPPIELPFCHPVGMWDRVKVCIPYDEDDGITIPLMDRHPTINGILADIYGRLVSIQILVPNKHGYKDYFFFNYGLLYVKSSRDTEGNEALDRAHREGLCFRAYVGFKANKQNILRLNHMGVPKRYHSKSFDLGLVMIRDITRDGKYVITPIDNMRNEDAQKAQEYLQTAEWNVYTEHGPNTVQSYY